MAEQIKVPGVLTPGTGTYHSYAKDIIDDQLRNKKQSELNTLFNQGKGLDANGNVVPVVGPTNADNVPYTDNIPASQHPSGSTGRKIKQLEDRIDSLVPAEEPTLGESVDLTDYMMSDNVALSFTYDASKKYVYGDKVTSMCTYARNNTSYAAFKVVDVDLYIIYTISGNTFTYYAQMDSETLPNEARSKFELGRYALVKQLQGATGDSWVDGTAGVFVGTDERPMAFKYVPSVEINSHTINNALLARTSNDSHIYVYRLTSGLFKFYTKVASSNATFGELNKLIVGSGGGDITGAAVNGSEIPKNGTILQFPAYPTSGTMSYSDSANYDAGSIGKAVKDAKVAANVSFDDSITQLGTQESPVDTVQKAINQLVAGIGGITGKLRICLKYQNDTPIAGKTVSIVVNYQGLAYDLSSQYSPDTQGFKTDSNGYIINNNSNEYIVLPLGATYTIHFFDISNSYLTPEDVTGIMDENIISVNRVYEDVSDNEYVLFFVQMPNVSPSIANVNDKVIYVDFYSSSSEHSLKYKCVLRTDGTVKQILNADGTQATYNGENLIHSTDPVLMPVPNGKKYLCSLQEWDELILSENQRYVKSSDKIFTASKAKRTVTFSYIDIQLGMFLLVEDSTCSYGYRECLITDIDSDNNIIFFIDGNTEYKAYLSNSTLYKEAVGANTPATWSENIIGYGLRTSTSVAQQNDDEVTQDKYPNCSFFIPKTRVITPSKSMLSIDENIVLPVSFSGLYLTRILSKLTDGQSSPLAQSLLVNNDYQITLNTPNSGTNAINGFIPSTQQIEILRANKTKIDQVHKSLTGSVYHVGSVGAIWASNLANVAGSKCQFPLYRGNDYSDNNPRARPGTSNYCVAVVYPF